jgi:hypothetical protein
MTHRFALVFAALCLAAASLVAQDPAKPADPAKKRAALERELALAGEKAGRAAVDVADQDADNKAALDKAATELGFAERKLKDFEEVEAPARLEKARLELQGGKDMLDDAREELAQLEMMYKDSEIGDKTKDMVLARGKRGLARAEARLKTQERDFEALESRTLPLERDRLKADAAEKRRDVERAKRAADKATFERSAAVKAAENEVRRIKEELAGLEGGK